MNTKEIMSPKMSQDITAAREAFQVKEAEIQAKCEAERMENAAAFGRKIVAILAGDSRSHEDTTGTAPSPKDNIISQEPEDDNDNNLEPLMDQIKPSTSATSSASGSVPPVPQASGKPFTIREFEKIPGAFVPNK